MARITRKQAQSAYDAGKPIMSDAEFDARFVENCGNLGSAGTVDHAVPMLSQQKCHYLADVSEFIDAMKKKGESTFWMSLKLDGIAASIEYKDGKISRVSTRGDGISGTDITAAAKKYIDRSFIPRAINDDRNIEIRGEIILSLSEMGYDPETNYRNIACGLMMRSELTESTIKCAFYAYDIIIEGVVLDEHQKVLELEKLGFNPVPGLFISFVGYDNGDLLNTSFEQIKHCRHSFDGACDGVVIKCNNPAVQSKLGCTKHHPRYSIAYKWQTKRVESTVIDIDIMTGKSGKKTPVARIEPVIIDGANVSSVSLGSVDMMEKRGIKSGCKVIVERSGGVIPRIVEVIR